LENNEKWNLIAKRSWDIVEKIPFMTDQNNESPLNYSILVKAVCEELFRILPESKERIDNHCRVPSKDIQVRFFYPLERIII
jgi:hypothetical protein